MEELANFTLQATNRTFSNLRHNQLEIHWQHILPDFLKANLHSAVALLRCCGQQPRGSFAVMSVMTLVGKTANAPAAVANEKLLISASWRLN